MATEDLETIRYTADVVATTPDGNVLLINRGWPPYKGHLALPGGHVDPGETAKQAAVRELLEETGIHVTEDDLTLIGVYDDPNRDPRGRYVTVAYTVTVPAGTTARAGDDATSVQWNPIANPGNNLAFDHNKILADARRRQDAIGHWAWTTEQGLASFEDAHGTKPDEHWVAGVYETWLNLHLTQAA
ncbi:NUDIX hydrolase [Streptomyces sp. AcH 505]|uniref:NUDIX domain-containing protein n=1 Tax=Streptomyces sp. AcH 505 TaxID=352211 RepID=UPI0007C6B7C0